MRELETAWSWRNQLGIIGEPFPIRVFHGPGEGTGAFQFFAVDRFGDHYWITEWKSTVSSENQEKLLQQIVEFYCSQGARSVVSLSRPIQGLAQESKVLFGNPPQPRFVVTEGSCKFWIQFENTRHPGLFLDHAPLRSWLTRSCKGMTVLNTFAYTGSLSVAAGMGKAKHVTTLDLSNATIQWAKDNIQLNDLSESSNRFIAGDVFEWLPRLKREKQKYDCIILDPPSFSHGKKGKFSTSKDLEKLHSIAIELLAEDGILISSINSSNVSINKFESDLISAGKSNKVSFNILRQIDLPETFPTRFSQMNDRYLKGWILKRNNFL